MENIDGIDAMVASVDRLRSMHGRVLLGLVGAPGAGKSTLAALLAQRVHRSCVVPMDGYSVVLQQQRQAKQQLFHALH